MKAFTLQTEGMFVGDYVDRSQHDTYEECELAAGELFDSGEDGDFVIRENETGRGWRLAGYKFAKTNCPVCNKEVRIRDMEGTYDCHGIYYRKVCEDCYDKIMDEKGFDGEEYTEADECIDYDY
jgi:hypothetical protein